MVVRAAHRLARGLPLLLLVATSVAGCGSRTAARSTDYDVIVVGAGIAGLGAAHFLRDLDVLVLEKTDRAGGRAVVGQHAGAYYAKGAEYLGAPEGALAALVADLELAPVEIPAPMDARWRSGGVWWGDDGLAKLLIGAGSTDTYNRFVATINGLYAEYDDATAFTQDHALAGLDRQTAADWLAENGFDGEYLAVYDVAARGLFGCALDEISMLGFLEEIAFDTEGVEPIADAAALENTPDQAGESTGSYTFRGRGLVEVTEALATEAGDALRLRSVVTGVEAVPGGYRVSWTAEDGPRSATALGVVLAVPAPVARAIAGDLLGDERATLLEQVPYSAYATVALFTDEPVFAAAFDLAAAPGLFFTDVYDATWVDRRGEGAPAMPILAVYVAPESYLDRSLLDLSDADLVARVLDDLDTLFPGVDERVVGSDVQRHPYAYPVPVLGAYGRLARLDALNRGTLVLAGDYTIYPTFEAAAESAERAATRVRQGLASR